VTLGDVLALWLLSRSPCHQRPLFIAPPCPRPVVLVQPLPSYPVSLPAGDEFGPAWEPWPHRYDDPHWKAVRAAESDRHMTGWKIQHPDACQAERNDEWARHWNRLNRWERG
jgi:hypothetical protein